MSELADLFFYVWREDSNKVGILVGRTRYVVTVRTWDKAFQLSTELVSINERQVIYEVNGYHGRYQVVIFPDGTYTCECPYEVYRDGKGCCSHFIAAIVDFKRHHEEEFLRFFCPDIEEAREAYERLKAGMEAYGY